MRIGAAALAATGAAAAVLAGCGGGDGRLSQEEFAERADAICRDVNERLDALPEPESFAEIVALVDEALPIQEEATRELRELRPPEDLEVPFARALELLDQEAELARELRAAAAAEDGQRIEEVVAEIEPIDDEADAIAEQLGLTECGGD